MRGNRWQFRVKHLLILTTIVIGLLMAIRLLTPIQGVTWTGGFDLQVTFVGDPGRPIESGVAVLLENSQHLELFKQYGFIDIGFQRISFDSDQSFDVHITTYGKTSSDGRDLSYHQPKYLGVVLTLEDETTRRLWVELPDGRETKEVEVNVTP